MIKIGSLLLAVLTASNVSQGDRDVLTLLAVLAPKHAEASRDYLYRVEVIGDGPALYCIRTSGPDPQQVLPISYDSCRVPR